MNCPGPAGGGEVLAHVAWREALSGDTRMLPEALKRFWSVDDAQSDDADESLAAQLDAAAARMEEHDRERMEQIRKEERAKAREELLREMRTE